ncbi:MAG: hypothetical protein NTX75_12995 [Proteobacteria bacterium]|nr:hypothetical protein [Pseudomonadota bacterium]
MDSKLIREIIRTLMESRFYFRLTLKERYKLVKYLSVAFVLP